MTDLFRDKYRIPPARLENYDYSSVGMYFITICTKGRIKHFGNINKRKMILSDVGIIVRHCWYNLPGRFKIISLDKFIIMPNHFHGIIEIKYSDIDPGRDLINGGSVINRRDLINQISTGTETIFSNTVDDHEKWILQKNQKIVLGKIVRSFKAECSCVIRKKGISFHWQQNYYEHIIRNESSLYRIRKYILNNPFNWELDRNYR